MKALIACAVLLGITLPASADRYLVSGSATLQAPYTYSTTGGANSLPVPATSLKAGDKLTYSFVFDTAAFGQPYIYDPNTLIYNGNVSNLVFSVGSYTASSISAYSGVQIWNGRVIGNTEEDSFSIYAARYIDGNTAPVALATGQVFEDLNFNFYDTSGTVRSSTSITEVENSSAYNLQSGFLAYLDTATNNQVGFNFSNIVMNFTAVPESATWVMLIFGFGMIGGIVRQASRRPVTT